MERERIDDVLNEFRPALQADGFDLRVAADYADGSVVIEVVHGPDACEDCLMSEERLAAMLQTALARVLPQVTRVEIRQSHG